MKITITEKINDKTYSTDCANKKEPLYIIQPKAPIITVENPKKASFYI